MTPNGANDCQLVVSFFSQSNEVSFPLYSYWKEYSLSYNLDPSNAQGYVSIVVQCDVGSDNVLIWNIYLNQVQLFSAH
jgi:hypothetical protein